MIKDQTRQKPSYTGSAPFALWNGAPPAGSLPSIGTSLSEAASTRPGSYQTSVVGICVSVLSRVGKPHTLDENNSRSVELLFEQNQCTGNEQGAHKASVSGSPWVEAALKRFSSSTWDRWDGKGAITRDAPYFIGITGPPATAMAAALPIWKRSA